MDKPAPAQTNRTFEHMAELGTQLGDEKIRRVSSVSSEETPPCTPTSRLTFLPESPCVSGLSSSVPGAHQSVAASSLLQRPQRPPQTESLGVRVLAQINSEAIEIRRQRLATRSKGYVAQLPARFAVQRIPSTIGSADENSSSDAHRRIAT